MKSNKRLLLAVVFTLTLGMAPFFPEPHFFGKVSWLLGGAKGMKLMDYFDLLLHGFPWIWLLTEIFLIIKRQWK
ncbi:MAG: hypothetical protein ACPF8V_08360 [Luteibaculum sp.]